jgi:hypothetical protein
MQMLLNLIPKSKLASQQLQMQLIRKGVVMSPIFRVGTRAYKFHPHIFSKNFPQRVS